MYQHPGRLHAGLIPVDDETEQRRPAEATSS
jgi:hypothetical protein